MSSNPQKLDSTLAEKIAIFGDSRNNCTFGFLAESMNLRSSQCLYPDLECVCLPQMARTAVYASLKDQSKGKQHLLGKDMSVAG